MVATVNGKGTNITYLDATDLTVAANAVSPLGRLLAGEGAPGHLRTVEDVVALDAAGLADTGSYYRLARFPSNAKIKRVTIFTDAAPDSNAAQQLALDFSVGWSDAVDGTPTAHQGLVPKNTRNGTDVAATDTNRNKLFGTTTLAGNNAAIPVTDITFNGTVGTYSVADRQFLPVEKIFGYTNGLGYDQHQIGFMDLIVKVATAAATGNACNLFARIEYVI